MGVTFHNLDQPYRCPQRRDLRLWLHEAVRSAGRLAGDIAVIFCSDDHLLGMNKLYLEHDYYTDIITFNYNEGDSVSGDLFISVDRVRDNAKRLGVKPHDEMRRVMIHGVLHLLGLNDKTPAEQAKMRREEDRQLKLFHVKQ